jgi:hypothetical protein
MELEQLDIYLQKNQVEPLLHILCENEPKTDQKPKPSTKSLRQEYGINLHGLGFGSAVLEMRPQPRVTT